ncbi:MAG TPA: RsmB/NOP family class I SAM-dependent RNA methyltransferase [Opitutaceae bacterium]|nr:RsmB/NOP family class I SAM-dependent RNA methyltransferase [Opitutaceae bacterium]
MPHSSSIRTAATVIRQVRPGSHADGALRAAFKEGRAMQPAERRAIAAATFAYFRWSRWLDARMKLEDRVARAVELQRRFDTDGEIPGDSRPLTLAAPDWVLDEIDFGEGAEGQSRRDDWARSLQSAAPLWIRARPSTAVALAGALGDCDPPEDPLAILCADALRYTGTKDLFKTPQFNAGEFEIQDIASQAVGAVCAPKPGETWWDACAGEGGKSLHLADQMANKGVVWCTDRSSRRAAVLKKRFGRAKLFNYRLAPWDGTERLPTRTKFDGILIDAPCSGIGTWRRNPDARWTTHPADVAELAVVQRRMLDAVAGSLKPGGRLIYAVCTLTRNETTEVASAFTVAHPELEAIALVPGCPTQDPGPETRDPMTLWPQETGGNGMFIAAWRKK